ncbi:MAG TPA: methylated-DNA--[protein]-cysteine S-methyltransferase [Candidatus Aphodoplasma excrementigallinarum]|uniref:Methylated-DNA--protein-cysteine methyltransferase n=1 Tax=Candidatus Aphodoplasma excrementigallinarum TaxID=2840673 RepID=A0A9D1T0A5_9FIRM|nr:methylated-DNA--[protein]-cysteine S-methyltransferase [Candidatus Aphodoplasma excrementigallinarum]
MVYTAHYGSPLGRILLAGREGALVGLWFEGQKYFPGSVRAETAENEDTPVLRQAAQWLDRYFAGERPAIGELNLAPSGSEFRKEIWNMLCEIPYGEVTTYGRLAKEFASRYAGANMSAQAAGGAVGHNPISIIIPCHRVVGANGSLTGYAGGVDKKLALLTHEGADLSGLFVPKTGSAL